MKAISLLQPYASLIVIGAKHYETRGWSTSFRGEVLIHASQGKKEEYKNLCMQEPFRKYIGGLEGFYRLPFGAVIGMAKIEDCVPTESLIHKIRGREEVKFGDYSTGRYAFKLVNPVMFRNPLQFKGALGLWEFPDEFLSVLK